MAPKKKGSGKKSGGKGKGEKKPAKVLMYHNEEYWNDRYTKQPEPFDWYQSYKELKGLLNIYIPKDQVNINVGCGNGCKCNFTLASLLFCSFAILYILENLQAVLG